MDAPNPSSTPTFASRTPLHIGAYGLAVRDLDKVAAYYRDVLGLNELERGNGTVRLGVDGVTLLELTHQPDFKPDDPRTAGLYHTAYLMPTRADLGRWLVHVAHDQVPVTGASDHGVSEAIYLDDPEGNGIEVYSDRPPSEWDWKDNQVSMKTVALDVQSLLRLGAEQMPWIGAPGGLRIGHIHLRVGAIETAEHSTTGPSAWSRRARAAARRSCHRVAITTMSVPMSGKAPARAAATTIALD